MSGNVRLLSAAGPSLTPSHSHLYDFSNFEYSPHKPTMSEKKRPEEVYYNLRQSSFPSDLNAVKTLFIEYTTSLGIDLTFQDVQGELSSLPGKYDASHRGTIILCSMSPTAKGTTEVIVGCAALRALTNRSGACELKRFYLVPEARGTGLGRKLLEQVIQDAKTYGYKEVLLDTLANMTAARSLYKRFGFEVVEQYYDTPIEGTVFMRLDLEKPTPVNLNEAVVA